jgi:hypothetical protein
MAVLSYVEDDTDSDEIQVFFKQSEVLLRRASNASQSLDDGSEELQ